MSFELERGDINDFAALLSRHWELRNLPDNGSTNNLIDQIFVSCEYLLAGKMICSAGGGGGSAGSCKEEGSTGTNSSRGSNPSSRIRILACGTANWYN